MIASGFEGAIVILIVIVVAIFFGGQFYGNSLMQKEAVSRGYASYCPADGNFAWLGECGMEEEK